MAKDLAPIPKNSQNKKGAGEFICKKFKSSAGRMARMEKGAISTGFFFYSAATSCAWTKRHHYFLPVPIWGTIGLYHGHREIYYKKVII